MTASRPIAVLGAGTMGHGIAQVAAMGGYPVYLYDLKREFIEQGLAKIRGNLEKGVARGKVKRADMETVFDRILGTSDLAHAVAKAGFVIEAAPEKLELKQDIFNKLSKLAPLDAILASNTSSISISKIAAASSRPAQVIGMHFFNPVHIMQLVELVRTDSTSEQTLAGSLEMVKQIGKTAIVVKDVPGFATSRLGVALGLEAIRMLESGVASAADIDKALELGYNHPMGPLRLTDLVGLDVRLAIAEYLEKEIGAQFHAPQLLRQMVAEGKLGKKTGQGFYTWES